MTETNRPPPAIGMEHCDRQVSGYPWGCVLEAATRTADAMEKYFVGGKALSGREYLVIANASATAYLNPLYTGDPLYLLNVGDPQGVDVPFTNIVLDTFGRLGPDGLAAAAVPAGATVAATTHVEGTNFFSSGGGATKHKLVITANGTDLEKETPEFCVGQKVNLVSSWVPDLPAGTKSKMGWFIGPFYANTIDPAHDGISPVYRVNFNLLTNPAVSLWWYDRGGPNYVSCTWTNDFANGKSVIVQEYGRVSVYRPSVSDFVCPGPRSFMWLGSYTLSYGDRAAGTNGMVWTAVINSKYYGRWAVTQIFRARYYVEPGITDTLNTLSSQAVDAGEYYDGYTREYSVASTDTHIIRFQDYPSLTCPGTRALINIASAEDYIRFKPGRYENDGNIYVTLGIVKWQAQGEYSRISGWLANSTPAASPPDDSFELPCWVRIVTETQ
jgi:hypothetical protein